jgi:hypothetical protein
MLRRDDPAVARSFLREALEVARGQSARTFEMRAALDLAG